MTSDLIEKAMESLKYLGDNPVLEIRHVNGDYFEARVVSCPPGEKSDAEWHKHKEAHQAMYLAMCAWDSRCVDDTPYNGPCRTCTDFGTGGRGCDNGRIEILRTHNSVETALRAFPSIKKIYHGTYNYRVWIEDLSGNVLKEVQPISKAK